MRGGAKAGKSRQALATLRCEGQGPGEWERQRQSQHAPMGHRAGVNLLQPTCTPSKGPLGLGNFAFYTRHSMNRNERESSPLSDSNSAR